MIFGAPEILICLAPFMLFAFVVGVRLIAQNRWLNRERYVKKCPNCSKLLNTEAYVCRFCRIELQDFRELQKR